MWCSPHSSTDEQVNGRRAMWRAVVLQAVLDAGTASMQKRKRRNRRLARKWLTRSPAFLMVCDFADLEPGYVIERAQAYIDLCDAQQRYAAQSQEQISRFLFRPLTADQCEMFVS